MFYKKPKPAEPACAQPTPHIIHCLQSDEVTVWAYGQEKRQGELLRAMWRFMEKTEVLRVMWPDRIILTSIWPAYDLFDLDLLVGDYDIELCQRFHFRADVHSESDPLLRLVNARVMHKWMQSPSTWISSQGHTHLVTVHALMRGDRIEVLHADSPGGI